MMSKNYLVVLLWLVATAAHAQLKIGAAPERIHPNSVLELESTDKALVLTRVTDAQMQAMQPLQGALVYNTDHRCLYYFDSSQWKIIAQSTGNYQDISFVNNGDGTFTAFYGANQSFTSPILYGPQ